MGLDRWQTAARTLACPYARDERQALLLLFLPFLLVASAVVVHQSARSLATYVLTAKSEPEREVIPIRPGVALSVSSPPAELASLAASVPVGVAETPGTPLAPLATPSRTIPSRDAASEPVVQPAASPAREAQRVFLPSEIESPVGPLEPVLATAPREIASPPEPRRELALLSPPASLIAPPRSASPAPVDVFEADADGNPILPGICSVADTSTAPITTATAETSVISASLSPEAFGLRLAEAAEAQAREAQARNVVIYDDTYRSIAYPMGDVHSMFGVCTDVVVRAYRALGLDLQALVHRSRSGRGDRSIDHRRTEVLRRFFATQGESLPVSPFAEEYRPGDIVTYYRPQNRGSRSHIAVVSSVIAPSGRPMIVHNRGWGPQLEDALFVDRITGHYRYRGPGEIRNAALGAHTPGIAAPTRPAAHEVAPAAIPISLSAPAN